MNPHVSATEGQAVEFLLRFTRIAHEAGGYPANELEPRIVAMAGALGLGPAQVSATPTVVNVALGPASRQQVFMLRVQPRPVDLHAINQLDEIASNASDGSLEYLQSLRELEELVRNPFRRPTWLRVGAPGLIGAALVPALGGGWRESLGAALVGLSVGFLINVFLRNDRFTALVVPLGAFCASFIATALVATGIPISAANVTLAGLVVLLPGMPLVIGVRELATGHLQAGIANAAHALVHLVGLGFGVTAGRTLAASWFGTVSVSMPIPYPRGFEIPAAAVAGLAFVVTLRAPGRDAIWTCLAAMLATAAKLVTFRYLGGMAGAFVAAMVVGLAGNAVARRTLRSPLTFVVPGLLMLIPGSIGFESAARLLAGQTVSGIDRAYDTFVTLLAIAYGLVASTLLLPDLPNGSRHGAKK